MSGPFRFTQEPVGSPLDRAASPLAATQPVNYKTNVNRAKTTKWVQAKKNAYDGDDWGDYDEYDEYGVNQAPQHPPEPQPSQPAQHRYYASHTQDQPARSFTAPAPQEALPKARRRNSFEHGEEQRAFSSSVTPHHDNGQHQHQHRHRDVSPTAQPPPLNTRISQVPAGFVSSPSHAGVYPPRKSSISQGETPVVVPVASPIASDKPLPFIRPADIYKRIEEERVRERASLDSSDPLSPRPADDVASSTADHDDQGLRSAVDRAFVRSDDQKSIPPTPIQKEKDKDNGSDMSRANTSSTSGISPIMSRVPSAAATSALRNPRAQHQGGESSTPAIAEEAASEAVVVSPPVTLPTIAPRPLAQQHTPPPPASPAHARNVSASSLPRTGFATPTRGDSPARSSVIALPHHDLPEPTTAHITSESLESPDEMYGGLAGPSPAYAIREADLAHAAAKRSSTSVSPQLAAAETQSQDAFLDSHTAQSPIQDAIPRDRSESPSKGRVQALAGKFGDVSHSRRGSTQSNLSKKSRNSMQSREHSRDNSRAASPTKASPSKPSSPAKEFRPHLPGQWESYATTANTPFESDDRERQLSVASNQTPSSLDAVDLTPTTAKRAVAEAGTPPPTLAEDPVAALKDAGAAMVQSLRTTVGLNDAAADDRPSSKSQPAHGNIYIPRPLQLERTISAQSSIPPTPPEKNTPESEFAPSPRLSEQASGTPGTSTHQQRPVLDPELSTDQSTGDQESDRLRREIVASLSPIRSSTILATDSLGASLQPLDASPDNRVSSILPREYDTYWAEADSTSSQPSQDVGTSVPVIPLAMAASKATHSEESEKPSILNRFSWEAKNPQLQSQEGPLPAVVMEPTKAAVAESKPSPAEEEDAAEEERQPLPEATSDSYFGPGHVITVTKPEPIADDKLDEQPSTPPLNVTSLTSPAREQSRSPGLHVVNTREDPEAVDLPPRFSADQQQAPLFSPEDNIALSPTPPIAVSPPTVESPNEVPQAAATSSGSAPRENTVTSPNDKPLGAREIAAISSAAERIATYNTTREQWATTDHGLQNWLTCTLHVNPGLVSQPFPVQRAPTATIRHRHTSSLALLGKLGGTSHHESTTEQHASSSAQLPAASTSPTAGRPSGPGFGGRVASQNMQLKGEKLLHTANVLGGKGMTSAKGLFAKGKSRFGRDKQVQ